MLKLSDCFLGKSFIVIIVISYIFTLFPYAPSEAKDSTSEFLDKANSLYLDDKYKKAITLYNKVLKTDHLESDIFKNKVVAVSELTPDFSVTNLKNTNNDALLYEYGTPYDQAIKIDPDNIQLLTNAGIYLADKKGMYNNAISLFDKVLEIDANYAPALFNKGLALDNLGMHAEAMLLFDKAKKIDFTIGPGFVMSERKR